jgi:hypothetical protein
MLSSLLCTTVALAIIGQNISSYLCDLFCSTNFMEIDVHPHATVCLLIGNIRPNFTFYVRHYYVTLNVVVYTRQHWATLSLRYRGAEKS